MQRVIAVMPLVLKAVPNAQYVVVGDGNYRPELERLAQQSSARNSILFRGPLTDGDKWATYAEASLFVLPSSEEGFGLVFLEANSFGKPVIGTNIMAIPEAIVHGKSGLLVELHDKDALANAMIKLLGDPVRMKRMGQFGYERVREEFTWDIAAKRVLELIRGSKVAR